MRTKTFAALAATGLVAAAVVTAGSASAADAPHVERGKRTLSQEPTRGFEAKSSLTAGGGLRLSGADRYETAAEISRAAGWTYDTTLTVFLASGASSADALAMGPSTLLEGPLLLTERDRLPDATRSELQRLRPCLVVVAGGASAVSDAVLADAQQYVDATGCGAV